MKPGIENGSQNVSIVDQLQKYGNRNQGKRDAYGASEEDEICARVKKEKDSP